MPLISQTVPTVADPRVDRLLRPRWHRARTRLLWSTVVFPFPVVAICLVFLGLAAGARGWAALPVLGAAVPAVAAAFRVRGRGLTDPPSWLRTAFLVAGCQLLLGVIPGYGIAANTASGPGAAVAGGLFALAWVCAGGSCVAAHRAHRTLLTPLVPELGATGFRLAVPARIVVTTPVLVSASVAIGVDGVEWSARFHKGRSSGPRVDFAVPFARLHDVVAVTLPPEPALRPWVTLPDGTVLYAQPGPALLLRTDSGEWMVPVHDAALTRELLLSRKGRWARGGLNR
ncbi:hypothetical protein ACQPW3_28085 [Actinosynnema sp. CA-248983]